jgi:glutathione S-transferase
MRVHVNPASPFARKVRIVARESKTLERLQEVETAVSPVAPNSDLANANPLIKIPALILDDGTVLYDSRVICEYLDSLGSAGLFPASGPERWNALRLQALCDGILDAAVLTRYETAVRPQELQWLNWIAGQRKKIEGGIAALEREQSGWGERFGIGQITAACACGYLDFRFPQINWRTEYPGLAKWFERASARSSVRETAPRA